MDQDIDPAATLKAATARYRETEQAHEAARDATVDAVLAALRAGMRPTDVTNASPFTAAYVRSLARKNGIEGSPRGGKAT